MDTKVDSISLAKQCLNDKQSFLLQGGAGSGKTEALKELLSYMSLEDPSSKLVCITHTNLAADEIRSRAGDYFSISTIHSFIQSLIKDYKINIKSVMPNLFKLPNMIRAPFNDDDDKKAYDKNEHAKYKDLCKKYNRRQYRINKSEGIDYVGKRIYDKDPAHYNNLLNTAIDNINDIITDMIESKDHHKIKYNNTKFNSFSDLSYGHDGLLDIFVLLFNNYPLLSKIIVDKYDYILIDEYQDTRPDIIECLLKVSEVNNAFCVCFFGDSMQSIYKEGVGNISSYVDKELIEFIPKVDNYRCSVQVLELINRLRFDKIKQEVAFKRKPDGSLETIEDRQGKVNFFYKVVNSRPNKRSSIEEKERHQEILNSLIEFSGKEIEHSKTLILTNKAIASEVGFANLYNIFSKRYSEIGDRIEKTLNVLMAYELAELCFQYAEGNYNNVISSINANGFVLETMKDKILIKKTVDDFIKGDFSVLGAIKKAIDLNFLKPNEAYESYLARTESFTLKCNSDEEYKSLKSKYNEGFNTYTKMKNEGLELSEEEFNEFEHMLKKEKFYRDLFSEELKFSDVFNYICYINEKLDLITMHKTKGASIDSVLVVLDEYFWSDYDFATLYNGTNPNDTRRIRTQKLFYVACSRARTNLTCVRLLEEGEVQSYLDVFPNAKDIGELLPSL